MLALELIEHLLGLYEGEIRFCDDALGRLLGAMAGQGLLDDTLVIITADHGCDPTFTAHTDHTREYVPMLAYGQLVRKGLDLGIRATFADCGQTIADIFYTQALAHGKSFKDDILSA